MPFKRRRLKLILPFWNKKWGKLDRFESEKKLYDLTKTIDNKPGFRPVSWQQQGLCFMLNAEKCAKSMLKS